MLEKLLLLVRIFFNLHKILYVNFSSLPFSQAIYLPILIVNSRILKLGNIKIDSPNISFGMIKLGFKANSLYRNSSNKIVIENRSTICFKGTCFIGHNSSISTGINGYIEFGDNFLASTTFKIASYERIVFGANTRVAWEVIILDTDFHELVDITTQERNIPTKPICIGKNNWIGIRSLVLKGTQTPDFVVFSAGSFLNKKYDFPAYSMVGGSPLKLLKTGVIRDLTSNVA